MIKKVFLKCSLLSLFLASCILPSAYASQSCEITINAINHYNMSALYFVKKGDTIIFDKEIESGDQINHNVMVDVEDENFSCPTELTITLLESGKFMLENEDLLNELNENAEAGQALTLGFKEMDGSQEVIAPESTDSSSQ